MAAVAQARRRLTLTVVPWLRAVVRRSEVSSTTGRVGIA
jgi:hypothetical protein